MQKSGILKIGRMAVIPMIFTGIVWLVSCEKYTFDPPTIDPGVQISFQNDIQPVFNSKCIACHGTGKNKPILQSGSAYESLTTDGYTNVAKPESSELYVQLTTNAGHKSILNDLQKQTILEWIKQGAQNN